MVLCYYCSNTVMSCLNKHFNYAGRGLTLCSTDESQCCVQNYIAAVTGVARNRLTMGLRLQMRETSELFNRTIALIGDCKYNCVRYLSIITYLRVYS